VIAHAELFVGNPKSSFRVLRSMFAETSAAEKVLIERKFFPCFLINIGYSRFTKKSRGVSVSTFFSTDSAKR